MSTVAAPPPSTPTAAKPSPPRSGSSASPRREYLELRATVHRKLLNRLNLEALAHAERPRAEAEIRTLLGQLLAEESAPLSLARARDAVRRGAGRRVRPRAARAAAARSGDQRHPGQHRASRSSSSAAAGSSASPPRSRTTRTCCASSTASSAASAAAWTTARRWSTPACPTARVSTPSSRRWRSMARCCRSAGFRPSACKANDLVSLGALTQPMLEFLVACVQRPAEQPDQRRHRRRQDHAAQRALELHLGAASASSPSKTRPNCSCTRSTWRAWKPVRPTSKARARSVSASW